MITVWSKEKKLILYIELWKLNLLAFRIQNVAVKAEETFESFNTHWVYFMSNLMHVMLFFYNQ